jgi:hypothetical protein
MPHALQPASFARLWLHLYGCVGRGVCICTCVSLSVTTCTLCSTELIYAFYSLKADCYPAVFIMSSKGDVCAGKEP